MKVSWMLLACLSGQGEEPPLGRLLQRFGQPGGLTLETAARRAVETAPRVEQAEASAAAASARESEATSRLIPQVSLRAGYTRVSDVDQPSLFGGPSPAELERLEMRAGEVGDPAARELWEADLGRLRAQSGRDSFQVFQNRYSASARLDWSLTQTLFSAQAALEAAGELRRAEDLTREVRARAAALEAARRFYGLMEARGQVELSEKSVERSRAVAREVEARVRAGAALESAALRARARLARAEGDRVRARAFASRAARQLATVLHRADTSTTFALSARFEIEPAPAFEAALERARAERPELEAARARVETARAEQRARSLERLPDLGVSAQYRWARPNPRVIPPVDEWRDDWRVGVSLAWSPTAQWGLTAATDRAASEARAAAARVVDLEDGIRDQVAATHARLRAAQAGVPPARDEVVAARAAYDVRLDQYRLGAATLDEVLEAERDLTAAEVRLLSALTGAAVAEHELRQATGLFPVEGADGARAASPEP